MNLYDKEGYLLNINHWNEDIASSMASKENIKLTNPHWEVIYFMRNFYFQYNIVPSIRMLIKSMKLIYRNEIWNSSYIFQLFPLGIKVQATKIAGLPKQINCL